MVIISFFSPTCYVWGSVLIPSICLYIQKKRKKKQLWTYKKDCWCINIHHRTPKKSKSQWIGKGHRLHSHHVVITVMTTVITEMTKHDILRLGITRFNVHILVELVNWECSESYDLDHMTAVPPDHCTLTHVLHLQVECRVLLSRNYGNYNMAWTQL